MTASSKLDRIGLSTLVTGAMLMASMLMAPAAQAGPLLASAPGCAEEVLSRPFLPWADPMQYQFAPDGGFEAGGEGWALGGGAATVAGNESYYLNGAADSRSLAMPAGSSVTSPTVCVGVEHPTIRFLARRASGGLLATLQVEVLFEDAAGNVHSAPIGGVLGSGNWQPTLQMPIGVNLLALLPGDHTPVAFRITADSGNWQIDDFYIDPTRRN